MPQEVEKCVEKVKQTVKPRYKNQTPTDAAWAICTDQNNKKKEKESMIEEITQTAKALRNKGEEKGAKVLEKIAQVFSEPQMSPQMVQPMVGNTPEIQITPPPIERFHGNAPMQDNRKTHICTLTFTAPATMTESEIMSLFMNLKQEGLVPTNFQWTEKQEKNKV
jgi:hypothetical protein